MAEAVAVGTLLAGTGATAAGATATGTLMGVSAATFAGVAAAGQAVGAFMSGREEARSIAAQQANRDLQVRAAQTQAAIEEENRQDRLRRVLATQSALFAGRGVSGGASMTAIGQDSLESAARESRQSRSLLDVNTATLRAESADLGRAKRAAMTSGILGAGEAITGFAGATIKRGGPKK